MTLKNWKFEKKVTLDIFETHFGVLHYPRNSWSWNFMITFWDQKWWNAKTPLCNNYVPQWWVEFEDELSWLFTKRFRVFFILFAENSQILLKISVIPILLTFMCLVALNLLVNNSTHRWIQLIIAALRL